MGFVSPLVSHSVPLEGEAALSPFQRSLCSLPPLYRTPSYDQRGHPPWNPRCFAAAKQQTRLSRETVPAQSSTGFLTHTLRLGRLKRSLPALLPTGRTAAMIDENEMRDMEGRGIKLLQN